MVELNKNICTVIPIYKSDLTDCEFISLKQYDAVVGNKYDVYFIIPEGLDIAKVHEIIPYAKICFFKPRYFDGIDGYNRLCMSSVFYETFMEYKYMVIYQTDALIFYDKIKYFADLDFDLYGPPLGHMENEALCGGFSMRKIEKCLKLTCFFEQEDFDILKYKKSGFKNEDIFFSLNFPLVLPYHLSCLWGWNTFVGYKRHLQVSNGKIPMGFHGFKDIRALKILSNFLKIKIV